MGLCYKNSNTLTTTIVLSSLASVEDEAVDFFIFRQSFFRAPREPSAAPPPLVRLEGGALPTAAVAMLEGLVVTLEDIVVAPDDIVVTPAFNLVTLTGPDMAPVLVGFLTPMVTLVASVWPELTPTAPVAKFFPPIVKFLSHEVRRLPVSLWASQVVTLVAHLVTCVPLVAHVLTTPVVASNAWAEVAAGSIILDEEVFMSLLVGLPSLLPSSFGLSPSPPPAFSSSSCSFSASLVSPLASPCP